MNNVISFIDIKKKNIREHTIESASVFSEKTEGRELTEEELEHVIGGMSKGRFEIYITSIINEYRYSILS